MAFNNYGLMNKYNGFKSVLFTLSAAAILLLASSPCPCKGQNPFLDSSNDPYRENKTPSKPKIKDKHDFKCAKYFYIGDENATLPCIATGVPPPQMSWSLWNANGSVSNGNVQQKNCSLSVQDQEYVKCTLRFARIEKSFEGIYRCKAVSGNDADVVYFNVKVLDPNRFWHGKPWIFIAFLAILVFISGVIMKIVTLKCCQPKSKLELSAEYKHHGTDAIEVVMRNNPPRLIVT